MKNLLPPPVLEAACADSMEKREIGAWDPHAPYSFSGDTDILRRKKSIVNLNCMCYSKHNRTPAGCRIQRRGLTP